jgi:hypothetical protein
MHSDCARSLHARPSGVTLDHTRDEAESANNRFSGRR